MARTTYCFLVVTRFLKNKDFLLISCDITVLLVVLKFQILNYKISHVGTLGSNILNEKLAFYQSSDSFSWELKTVVSVYSFLEVDVVKAIAPAFAGLGGGVGGD